MLCCFGTLVVLFHFLPAVHDKVPQRLSSSPRPTKSVKHLVGNLLAKTKTNDEFISANVFIVLLARVNIVLHQPEDDASFNWNGCTLFSSTITFCTSWRTCTVVCQGELLHSNTRLGKCCAQPRAHLPIHRQTVHRRTSSRKEWLPRHLPRQKDLATSLHVTRDQKHLCHRLTRLSLLGQSANWNGAVASASCLATVLPTNRRFTSPATTSLLRFPSALPSTSLANEGDDAGRHMGPGQLFTCQEEQMPITGWVQQGPKVLVGHAWRSPCWPTFGWTQHPQEEVGPSSRVSQLSQSSIITSCRFSSLEGLPRWRQFPDLNKYQRLRDSLLLQVSSPPVTSVGTLSMLLQRIWLLPRWAPTTHNGKNFWTGKSISLCCPIHPEQVWRAACGVPTSTTSIPSHVWLRPRSKRHEGQSSTQFGMDPQQLGNALHHACPDVWKGPRHSNHPKTRTQCASPPLNVLVPPSLVRPPRPPTGFRSAHDAHGVWPIACDKIKYGDLIILFSGDVATQGSNTASWLTFDLPPLVNTNLLLVRGGAGIHLASSPNGEFCISPNGWSESSRVKSISKASTTLCLGDGTQTFSSSTKLSTSSSDSTGSNTGASSWPTSSSLSDLCHIGPRCLARPRHTNLPDRATTGVASDILVNRNLFKPLGALEGTAIRTGVPLTPLSNATCAGLTLTENVSSSLDNGPNLHPVMRDASLSLSNWVRWCVLRDKCGPRRTLFFGPGFLASLILCPLAPLTEILRPHFLGVARLVAELHWTPSKATSRWEWSLSTSDAFALTTTPTASSEELTIDGNDSPVLGPSWRPLPQEHRPSHTEHESSHNVRHCGRHCRRLFLDNMLPLLRCCGQELGDPRHFWELHGHNGRLKISLSTLDPLLHLLVAPQPLHLCWHVDCNN